MLRKETGRNLIHGEVFNVRDIFTKLMTLMGKKGRLQKNIAYHMYGRIKYWYSDKLSRL